MQKEAHALSSSKRLTHQIEKKRRDFDCVAIWVFGYLHIRGHLFLGIDLKLQVWDSILGWAPGNPRNPKRREKTSTMRIVSGKSKTEPVLRRDGEIFAKFSSSRQFGQRSNEVTN